MELVVIAAVVAWAATALLVWLVFRLGGQFWQSNALLLERVERLESAAAELRKKISPEPEQLPPKRLPIGSEAPSFDLPDLNGRRVSLGQYLGRPLVLVFFGADCGFCTKMAPALAKEVRKVKPGRPVPIVVASGDEEEAREEMSKYGFNCPVLLDGEAEFVTQSYNIDATPEALLVDEQGRIASDVAVGERAILELVTRPRASWDHLTPGRVDDQPHPVGAGSRNGRTPVGTLEREQ
jgi:peroxiredoxin